jgi:hypothetical protein
MSTGGRSAALELLLVLAATAWLLHGFWNRLDLNPRDEGFYLWQGIELSAGRWPQHFLAWSPGLSATYALLAAVLPSGVIPSDAMLVLVNLGSVVALWWALRALVAPALAVTFALGWAGAETLVMAQAQNVHPSTYAWCSVFAFASVGALARGCFRWALLLLLIASMNRTEYAAWWIAWAAVLWVRDARARRWSRRTFAVTALGAAVLLLGSWSPAHRARMWWTFRQHYDAVIAGQAGEDPALTESERRELLARSFAIETPHADRDFRGATGVAGAALRNPRAMLAHVARNAARLPGRVAALWDNRFLWAQWLATLWKVLLLASLAGIAIAPRACLRALRAWPRDAVVLLASAAGLLAVALVTGPRTELLYPLVPLGAALSGIGLARLPRLWLLPTALLAALAVAGAPFPSVPERMVLRDAVHAVHELVPAGAARVGSLYGEVLPTYAARPDLEGQGPDPVRAEQEAEQVAAWGRDADYLLLHAYVAPALPVFTAAMWRVAEERALDLLELSPRCIAFGPGARAPVGVAAAEPPRPLSHALAARDPRTREAALVEIGRRRSVAPEDAAALRAFAEDEDAMLRWAAVWALGRLREPFPERDAILRDRLASDDGIVRAAACWALASGAPAAARELLVAPAAEAGLLGFIARQALARARRASN